MPTMSKIETIQQDMARLRMDGNTSDEAEVSLDGKSVSASFRDVGRWIHDEERGRECEEDGDPDWREDDDHMIWAPGEYQRYMEKFTQWAKGFPWFKDVVLDIDTSEKNWVAFSIKLK